MYLCTRIKAQMAESVDALVSNTSGAIRAGSTPALGTTKGMSPCNHKLRGLFICEVFSFAHTSEWSRYAFEMVLSICKLFT